jgi:hypothetical protein
MYSTMGAGLGVDTDLGRDLSRYVRRTDTKIEFPPSVLLEDAHTGSNTHSLSLSFFAACELD